MISKSAFRGHEVLYPEPEQFGQSTSSANKDFGLDWSHFQLMAALLGAEGIKPESDKALFTQVDTSTTAGGIPLKIPLFIAGLGSTAVAKNHWKSLSMGAALSGTMQVVGENVCGMDNDSKFKESGKGKQVVESPDLRFRVESYRQFWDGKYGDIVVQTNVEDQRLGADLYAISTLEVNTIERKWGQGAKAIGGEVRLDTLERARLLKGRGYVVLPDPDEAKVAEAFKAGVFQTFERHSRVGMPDKTFVQDVEWLREHGAKHVFLKTGAYRPAAVAFTLKMASDAHIDLLTFDGAGGGTGMSPMAHMNELSTPTVYLAAQVLRGAQMLKKKGKHVPDLAIAGGFIHEAQIVKAIALSNFGDGPLIKAVAMARSPITAAMKSDYFVQLAKEGKLPKAFEERYTNDPEKFFVASTELSNKYGSHYKDIPKAAIGVYTYFYDRLRTGIMQLLAGLRKWKLNLVSRNDLAALSPLASEVTGIPMPHQLEADIFERILS
jgi:glutamate synthase domain-containing protein 2